MIGKFMTICYLLSLISIYLLNDTEASYSDVEQISGEIRTGTWEKTKEQNTLSPVEEQEPIHNSVEVQVNKNSDAQLDKSSVDVTTNKDSVEDSTNKSSVETQTTDSSANNNIKEIGGNDENKDNEKMDQ